MTEARVRKTHEAEYDADDPADAAVATHLTLQQSSTPLLDLERFSSLHRVLRVTAWVKRFLHNCRHPLRKKHGVLVSQELHEAETYWVLTAQRQGFGPQPRSHESLQNVTLLRDEDDILRLKGRLQYSDFPTSLKHPIVIPTDHPLTALLVHRAHARLLHAGVQDTLTDLRERYWIIRGRQVVKRLLHRCRVCRRAQPRACIEATAPLPRDRSSPSPPFEVTGTDYAGPLYFRSHKDGAADKCYILIFTCAVTRAVHLDITKSMSASDFMMAFKRFISRRGIPAIMYSDNFRTFKAAGRDLTLAELSQNPEVGSALSSHRVAWKFIAERAAWWGGFWERLNRSVKVCLRKVLGRTTLTYEQLRTLVTEVEAVINSRPLTYVAEDPDSFDVITPAHSLVGKRASALPMNEPPSTIRSTSDHLRRRWKYREHLTDLFWKKWSHEYILQLRSANVCKPLPSCSVKAGDIVLVFNEKKPRVTWPLGRVSEVKVSPDGRVRSCRVTLPSGKVIHRPIQLLHNLEADD